MLLELGAAVGLVAGLGALWRGPRAQRTGARVEGIGTSPIATLAAGEVRVTGVVEHAGVTLTSPILGLPVVYYDSRVRSGGNDETNTWQDSRAVSFFVRDSGASIRVLPGGASWDMPLDIDDSSGLARPMGRLPGPEAEGFDGLSILAGAVEARPRRMTEACLEPGDRVTVVGRALPFGDLADPANAMSFSAIGAEDPEIAADLAAARAAGTLADDPAEAWGNAAIPGFGIGQPVRPPELETGVAVPAIAAPEAAAAAAATFDISPDVLVLASTDDAPLLIAGGGPAEAAERSSDAFLLGLLGAVLAIGSAIVLALMLGPRLGA